MKTIKLKKLVERETKDYGNLLEEALCGNCDGVLLGYDEEICPSCGCLVDWNIKAEIIKAEE
ncbi:MAG TPA: hypothetical protein VI815_02420 [Candidatus Nanoarchaeia archaeon]|nr:hypothetical protein [Candidatus Nanoarchaeia archaeon]